MRRRRRDTSGWDRWPWAGRGSRIRAARPRAGAGSPVAGRGDAARQRRLGLQDGWPGSFRRFAAVETGVLLATVTVAVTVAVAVAVAVAVVLAGSPPPSTGTPASAGAAGVAGSAPSPGAASADMAGHDHGELSVTVLIDETRFPGDGAQPGTTEVTITAEDGSFDVVVPSRTLITFEAPDRPGTHPFTSRHSASFPDVLEAR